MQLLLSIIIATYNRANFINQTINSIIPQLSGAVELLVVDGASTDNTEALMQEYLRRCDRIRYVRLQTKGGVDQDYNRAVELARGKYCWLFTDDDIVKPEAVKTILSQIAQGYELIIMNAEVRNPNLSNVLEKNRLDIINDRVYMPNEFEKFFLDNVLYMSFIGCVIIRRDIWIEREKEKYFDSDFIHLGVIFQKRLRSAILVVANRYISIRFGNEQWSSRTFEIWALNWPKLIWSFDVISTCAKSFITPQEPWRKITKLLFLRAKGNFGLYEYYKYIRPNISSLFERMIIKSVALLPGYFVNCMATVYCTFKTSQDQLDFYVLKNSKYHYLNFVQKLAGFKLQTGRETNR